MNATKPDRPTGTASYDRCLHLLHQLHDILHSNKREDIFTACAQHFQSQVCRGALASSPPRLASDGPCQPATDPRTPNCCRQPHIKPHAKTAWGRERCDACSMLLTFCGLCFVEEPHTSAYFRFLRMPCSRRNALAYTVNSPASSSACPRMTRCQVRGGMQSQHWAERLRGPQLQRQRALWMRLQKSSTVALLRGMMTGSL